MTHTLGQVETGLCYLYICERMLAPSEVRMLKGESTFYNSTDLLQEAGLSLIEVCLSEDD